MPQPLRSTDPELRELRHRYNRLFARFSEVADTDPALMARAVQELQDLSDRIVALEGQAAPSPSAPVADAGKMDAPPVHSSTPVDAHKIPDEAAPPSPTTGEPAAEVVALWPQPAPSRSSAVGDRDKPRPLDLDRLRAAIERQEAQIAALLRKTDEHRQQLAAMEQRIIERHPVKSLVPEIEALGRALDQQQQRITQLAMALQRLLQWLAAERQRPKS